MKNNKIAHGIGKNERIPTQGGGDFAGIEPSSAVCKLKPVVHIRKDTLVKTVQWWKHLRAYWKRRQQRLERVASAKLIRAEWDEQIKRIKN
jgi:hypothetical protein